MVWTQFTNILAENIAAKLDIEITDISASITPPTQKDAGDLCLPCFPFAKSLRINPILIAQQVADATEDIPFITEVVAVKGFVNWTINSSDMIDILWKKSCQITKPYISSGQTVVIDYSSPNIAKPFGIGHLRSTIIGQSLKNILQHMGHKVVGINHLGDWGTQFGKMIYAYLTWHADEQKQEDLDYLGSDLGTDPIAILLKLYVKFHQEAKKDPSLENEARLWFKKLEANDPVATTLWKKFSDLSLDKFQVIYRRLGVAFDHYTGEAFFNNKMDSVITMLEEKNLLSISQDATVVDLTDKDLPPCLIKKSDGATLYATRDLAAIMYRKNNYKFDRILYVVGQEQKLHFRQLFAVIDKAGMPWANTCEHIPFGLIRFQNLKIVHP